MYLEYEDYSTVFDYYKANCGAVAQDKTELWGLIQVVQEINPTSILEIGVESGGTSSFWNRICGNMFSPGKVVGLDLDPNILVTFPVYCADTCFIKGDSHTQEAYDKVRAEFPDKIDFLFIDGDHTYEGVKQDYEVFSPLVRSGGIIAFHDIGGEGVMRFWPEVRAKYTRIQEFHITIGIGVLYVA